MKPQSAKAKGRLLQQAVCQLILDTQPSLLEDDVRSTSMGAGGVDVQLSPAAQKLVPYAIECKSLARSAVYKDYQQASAHSNKLADDTKRPVQEPLLVLKVNRQPPLVIMDAAHFFTLIGKTSDDKRRKRRTKAKGRTSVA
jgi:hypothetical protein